MEKRKKEKKERKIKKKKRKKERKNKVHVPVVLSFCYFYPNVDFGLEIDVD